jgi:arabinogalactan endo-1,4-beta-galactosidase
MEATGCRFQDENGFPADCLEILKENGINAIRLRVFVNPSLDRVNGHCSKMEVLRMAIRARNLGFRIMIDFHYSDSWAGPTSQAKPAAWRTHDFPQLLNDVYEHTYDVLSVLKQNGVVPEWVQVGNEIPNGLLWPEGNTSHWPQLAQLLNKGYDAVKAVDQCTKVVIHLDQGNDNRKFRRFFDNLKSQGGKWDVIGMSYYPHWLKQDYTVSIDNLGANLNDMASRYGKEVMVVEVGGEDAQAENTYDMLMAVQRKVEAVPDNRGLGIFYWEPEGEKSWSGYGLSCWDAGGRPTKALTAFNSRGMP